jgi:hypothetical protein
VTDISRRRNL